MAKSGAPGWRAWLAVAAGGLLGSELRYGLGLVFPEGGESLPWTTLGINVVAPGGAACLSPSCESGHPEEGEYAVESVM